MKRQQGQVILVETLTDVDRRLAQGVTSLRGWRVRGLDLRDRSSALRRVSPAGAMFVGCQFGNGDTEWLEAHGALVMPRIPESPVDTYRASLYTPTELYDTPSYAGSLDARAYAWSQQGGNGEATLARSLHDHAIDEALERWLDGRRIVGVMGGHAADRGTDGYREAAELGHALGAVAGCTVATGGGPGAMEAANLGAYLAGGPRAALDDACGRLGTVPSFRPSVQAWVEAAFDVRARHPDGAESLGIPTWHYGHEPPNVFASRVAKYFRNSTREATLLAICDAGIVFLPGAAGTVQEVFQDACENYYADASSVTPMVLVGRKHWSETLPVWPLLQAMSLGSPMEGRVHLVDTPREAADLLC